jgi:hypothetical protein
MEVLFMAKKKVYIPQFYLRDKKVFEAISRTGIVRIDHLKQHCKVVDSRIQNYIRDGLAEKVLYKENNQIKEALTLTRAGRELAEKQWNIKDHYHAQTKSPYHDLDLSQKYFSLPEAVRETWKTETHVRDQFMEKLQELRDQGQEERADMYYQMLKDHAISMPDAVYTENGVEVAYECLTHSYGRSEMLAKETAIEIMQYRYETNRI